MKALTALALLAASAARPSMNILRLASAVTEGETFTIAGTVFEIDSDNSITSGRVRVNVAAAATLAAASKVLTFATNVEEDDTVTIGATTYTFKDALTAPTTANEVLIGADLTESRNNLVAAVMKAAGGGTTYGSATVANASCTAVATSTNALTATAILKGTGGNSIAIAEASTHLSWASGHTALSGGADATGAEAVAPIVTAINSVVTGFRAQAGGANDVLVVSTTAGRAGAFSETLAGSNNAWAAADAYGGTLEDDDLLPLTVVHTRTALAVEVAVGVIRFPLNWTPVAAHAVIRTSAGVLKTWDGAVTVAAGLVTVDNTGSSDFAAGDTVTIIASR